MKRKKPSIKKYIKSVDKIVEQNGSCKGVSCFDCPMFFGASCNGDHVPSCTQVAYAKQAKRLLTGRK